MQILDYITEIRAEELTQPEKAKYLVYYYYKETKETYFTMGKIIELFTHAGYSAPNPSRLKESLIKGKNKIFIISKVQKNCIEFIPIVLQELERNYSKLWIDEITIQSDSELIDENKFCGKRGYLTRLIQQINSSYKNHCYDACAVLMRRLFEVSLVLSYQHHGIDDEIKDATGSGYVMLDGIVKNAKNNTTLKLSRIKNEFDAFRMIGNFSAHNITYTAGKKDIDDIKLTYRVMLEELYNKAGVTV